MRRYFVRGSCFFSLEYDIINPWYLCDETELRENRWHVKGCYD
jgi:hypothetical protein